MPVAAGYCLLVFYKPMLIKPLICIVVSCLQLVETVLAFPELNKEEKQTKNRVSIMR